MIRGVSTLFATVFRLFGLAFAQEVTGTITGYVDGSEEPPVWYTLGFDMDDGYEATANWSLIMDSLAAITVEGKPEQRLSREGALSMAWSSSGDPMALCVFGHLEPTTCHQSLELPLEPFDAERFKQVDAGIEPKLLSGTPLGESITLAGENLAESEGQKMVVLVTDGEESCEGDPGAAIEQLRAAGVDTVNIVGFALEDGAVKDTFREWAEIGGGRYLDAASGEELGAALLEILQPEFIVFDGSGVEVARGRVNDDPISIPSGLYDVRVLSVPEKRIDGVRVVERDVRLTVRLREGDGE